MTNEQEQKLAELVPEHLRDGLSRWIDHGQKPGHFLTAVLENDLFEAVGHADEQSLAGLRGLVQFLHCYTPGDSHGSREAVAVWREKMSTRA